MQCGTIASTSIAANSSAALQMSMPSPSVAMEHIIVSLEKVPGRRRARSCSNGDPVNVDGFLEAGMFDYNDQDSPPYIAQDEASCSSPVAPQRALTVYNILATAVLVGHARLDLDKCCSVLGNCYYCPSEFPALRVDVRGVSSIFTVSLFDAGRILATGGCRPVEAKRAMLKIARRLRERLGYSPLSLESFEIQNMLAVFDSGSPINLRRFAATFKGGSVDYDPDRFAGARVRLLIPEDMSMKWQGDSVDASLVPTKNNRVMNKLRRLLVGDEGPQFSVYRSNTSSTPSSDKAGSEGSVLSSYSGVGCYMMPVGALRPPSASPKARRVFAGVSASVSSDRDFNSPVDSPGRCPSPATTANRPEWVAANVFSTGKISLTGARSIRSFQMVLDQILPALGHSGRDHASGSGATTTPAGEE